MPGECLFDARNPSTIDAEQRLASAAATMMQPPEGRIATSCSIDLDSDRHFRTDYLMSDLKGRSVRGGAITLSAQAVKFILQMGSTMVLARLLTPADFGLVAMVTVVTGFAAMLKDAGLSMATIQREHITHEQVSTLFWINVVLSIVVMLIVAGLAPAIAWFYDEPRLVRVTLALSGTFVFSGLTVQHQALLRRQMRFKALALIEVLSMAAGSATAIIMAFLGCGYWSLAGLVAGTAIANCTLVWCVSQWRPGPPVRGCGVRPMLAFGGNLTGFTLVNYFGRNADNVLVGWWLGAGTLGLYSKAYALLLLPIRQITGPIGAVALPVLCRLHQHPEKFRRFYCRAINGIAYVSFFPIAIAGVLSKEIITLVLGRRWEGAAPIFMFLTIAALFQPVLSTLGWICTATGRTPRLFKWALISVPIYIASFVIGMPWGAEGVAIAYAVAVIALLLPGFAWCLRGSPVRVADVVAMLLRPLALAMVACVTILILTRDIEDSAVRLGVAIPGATFAWLVVMLLWKQARGEVVELAKLVKVLKSGRPDVG